MSTFLDLALSLPTAIYTGFVLLFSLYWFTTILGMTEIEMLDFDVDDAVLDFSGLMARLKLDGVPVTMALSLLFYFTWVVSLFAQNQLNQLELSGPAQFGASLAVLLISLLIGDVIASLCVKPLRKVFSDQEVLSKKNLVGQTVIVRSNSVTETFGDANFHDGGAGISIKIRAPQPNQLSRGDSVLVVEYLVEQDAFHVIPNL